MLIEKRPMEEALKEARAAAEAGEAPIGAVVVRGGEIVSRAHNEIERTGDASAHAELLALKRASVRLGTRYLNDCALFVTMEPCPMCAGACLHFRIGAVVFGAYDDKCGAFGSKLDLGCGEFGQEIPVVGGMMKDECAAMLKEFFKGIR